MQSRAEKRLKSVQKQLQRLESDWPDTNQQLSTRYYLSISMELSSALGWFMSATMLDYGVTQSIGNMVNLVGMFTDDLLRAFFLSDTATEHS